jgi:hypothetical protein
MHSFMQGAFFGFMLLVVFNLARIAEALGRVCP